MIVKGKNPFAFTAPKSKLININQGRVSIIPSVNGKGSGRWGILILEAAYSSIRHAGTFCHRLGERERLRPLPTGQLRVTTLSIHREAVYVMLCSSYYILMHRAEDCRGHDKIIP
jgi:hypothetical protein